jgi:hypothetical protein
VQRPCLLSRAGSGSMCEGSVPACALCSVLCCARLAAGSTPSPLFPLRFPTGRGGGGWLLFNRFQLLPWLRLQAVSPAVSAAQQQLSSCHCCALQGLSNHPCMPAPPSLSSHLHLGSTPAARYATASPLACIPSTSVYTEQPPPPKDCSCAPISLFAAAFITHATPSPAPICSWAPAPLAIFVLHRSLPGVRAGV